MPFVGRFELAIVLAPKDELITDDFSFPGLVKKHDGGESGGLEVGKTVSQMERELVLKTLEHCGDNRTRVAEMLGISVRTMHNKLNEYGQKRGCPRSARSTF